MRKFDLLAASAMALVFVQPAFAQDPAPPVAAEEEPVEEAADEIIVTAAGRAQLVQDVPIAVSVIGGEALENAGIEDIRAVRQLAPSLQTTTGQSAATGTVLRIRGVGTAGDNPGFEPAVGVFIDGVFRSRAGVALAELPPIERIEVLRGPQGTLFGRNTSAGALSIVTQGPSFDLGGYAEASYGNYDEIQLAAGITGPVSDVFALRLDGGYHKRDGYIRDVNSDTDINNIDRYFVRGQALYERDTVSFRLIADYAETDEQCCGALNTGSGFVLLPSGQTDTNSAIAFIASNAVEGLSALNGADGIVRPFNRENRDMAVSPGRNYLEAVKEYGISGQLDWEIGDNLKLTSITAYRDWQVRRNQDIDFSGLDRAYREGYRNEIRDFTQELRLQGEAFEGKLDWLVGGFYLNEKLKLTDTVRFGSQADQFVDQIFAGLTRQPLAPNGLQLFGTIPGVPLFGQAALASNPALAAAAAAGGPAVLATFLQPLPRTPAGAGQVADRYQVDTQAFAIFTHNIINFSDTLSLTLGLRYNHESKDIDADLNSAVPACDFFRNPNSALFRQALASTGASASNPAGLLPLAFLYTCNPTVNTEFNGQYSDDRSENELTGTAKLAWKITPDVLLYGGYDHGYKSGGYNLDRATFDTALLGGNGAQLTDLEFGKETVDSYEIGLKTTFSPQFTFNITGFYQTFSDFQDLTFIGTSFRVSSIEELRAKGVELDAVIRPHRDLTVTAGYAYTEAEYRDDNLAPPLNENNGIQVTNTPKNVVTTSITWTPQLSDTVGLLAHADMRFNSDSNTVNSALAVPFTTNDGYAIVNARLGLNFNERISVEAYVENVFDVYYNITGFPVPEQGNSYAVYPNTPRFYGVKARVSF